MNSYGIRQAKAHLSELVRNAAGGTWSVVTDNGKPVAMIGPLPEEDAANPASTPKPSPTPSDAAAFRLALLSLPHALDLDF